MSAEVLLASFDRVPSAKGASQHILANAAALSENYEVSLITLGDEPLAGYRHRPVAIADKNWLSRGLTFGSRVEDLLDSYDFDVCHVRSPFEGLAIPPSAKLIYEVNGLYSIEHVYHHADAGSVGSIRAKLRQRELCLLERADLILTPSKQTAEYLDAIASCESKIRVIPNSPSFATKVPNQAVSSPIKLCYIGGLTPWQGMNRLLRMLNRIDQPLVLSIVATGNPKHHKNARKMAAKSPHRINWVAPMAHEELGEFLNRHDVGLAPLTPCERNLMQGCCPIKIIDYLNAGLAVFAPDMPVVRDIVGSDYPLYKRWSKSAMREAMRNIVENEKYVLDLKELSHQVAATITSKSEQKDALQAAYAELLD